MIRQATARHVSWIAALAYVGLCLMLYVMR